MAGELRLRSVADLRHVLAVVDVLDADQADEVRMGLVVVEGELGQAADGRGRIEIIDVDALLGTADGAVGALEDGDEEPFLALEVVVDHPLRRARPGRDLVHARAREAMGRELVRGHVEDLAACAVAVADRPPASGAC